MTKINIDYQEIKKSYIGVTKTPSRKCGMEFW